MKTIRVLVLILAGGAFAIGGSYAQGQAEVSPDHFEPAVHVSTAVKPATPLPQSRHHNTNKNTHMTASGHVGKQRRHHSHALA